LFKSEFYCFAFRWIALKRLYQISFEFNSIRSSTRSQSAKNHEGSQKMNRQHLNFVS